MRELGIAGAVRGKKVVTTVAEPSAERGTGPDRPRLRRTGTEPVLGRGFHPRRRLAGVVYVAFVVDTSSRRIVGWSAAMTKQTQLVLDAVEMGIRQRDRDGHRHIPGTLVHHSDAGSQGGFNRSSQHPDLGGVQRGHGGLECENQRSSGGAASAVACRHGRRTSRRATSTRTSSLANLANAPPRPGTERSPDTGKAI